MQSAQLFSHRTSNLLVVCILQLVLMSHRAHSFPDIPTAVKPLGFHVLDVVQDKGTQLIQVIYNITASSSVVAIPYFSKSNWWKVDGANQWDIKNNPCYGSDDLCCIKALYDTYQVDRSDGAWYDGTDTEDPLCVDGVNAIVGRSIDNVPLYEMSYPSTIVASDILMDTLNTFTEADGLSYSSVLHGDVYMVTMTFPLRYFIPVLENGGGHANIALERNVEGVVKYQFFIGVVFITPRRSDNSVYIDVVQQNIEFTKSDFMFFSTATDQDRTPVHSVDLFIHQGRSSSNKVMQYVEFYIGYDESVYVGGIQLNMDSLKWIRSSSYESNYSKWNTPCGLQGYYTKEAIQENGKSETESFQDITCLPQTPSFCQCRQGRLWLPFHIEDASPEKGFISGPDFVDNIYMQLSVTLIDSNGDGVEAFIFTSIDLDTFPVLEHCKSSILEFNTLVDVLTVTAAIGVEQGQGTVLQSHLSTISSTSTIFMEEGPANILPSYSSAALDIQISMNAQFGTQTKFRLDNLIVMNFLGKDNDAYQDMMDKIKTGTAFTVTKSDTASKLYSIQPNVDELCTQIYDRSVLHIDNFYCMWRSVIVDDTVLPEFEESIFYMDQMGNFDEEQNANTDYYTAFLSWYDKTYESGLNPESEIGKNYLYDRCISYDRLSKSGYYPAYGVNDQEYETVEIPAKGSYGCVFIDPGYRWISRRNGASQMSTFDISDKTLVAAILTIVQTDGTTGRRLLMHDGEDISMYHIDESEIETDSKPIMMSQELGDQKHAASSQHTTSNENDLDIRSLIDPTAVANTWSPQSIAKMQTNYIQHHLLHGSVLRPRNVREMSASPQKGVQSLPYLLYERNRKAGRNLLSYYESEAEHLHLKTIMDQSSSSSLVQDNDWVMSDLNIAYMTGHNNYTWQMFNFHVFKQKEISWSVFRSNLQNVFQHCNHLMGADVIGANVTGLLAHSDSEDLYQNISARGQSTAVHVYGILRSQNVFSALFRETLKCILAVSVSSTTSLTVSQVIMRAQNCSSSTFASTQQQLIDNLFLTSCGNGMTPLNEDTCSVIYNPIKVNPEPAALFYTAADAVAPVLFFKIVLDKFVAAEDEEALVASTRENLAYSLNVQIDTILLELKTKSESLVPTRRRLLAVEQSLLVWVYPEPSGRGYSAFPPESTSPGDVYAQKRGSIQRGLVNLVGTSRMSETAETVETGFSVAPVLPLALGHFSLCIVDMVITPIFLRSIDKETLLQSLVTELSVEFLIPKSQVRLITMNRAEDSDDLRIITEIRVATSSRARQLSMMLRDNAISFARKIQQRISQKGLSTGTTLFSVVVKPGNFLLPEHATNERVNGVEVVFSIIGIVVSMVGLLLIWFACYSHPFNDDEANHLHMKALSAIQVQEPRPLAITMRIPGSREFVANLDPQLHYPTHHMYRDYIPMRVG